MLRTVLLRSELIALVRTVRAATCCEERQNAPDKPPPMRTSDLPIHKTPHADYGEYMETKSVQEITKYIKAVQQECTKCIKYTAEYLQKEENNEIRYGAVAMGGICAFMFIGGSIMRRLKYMGIGSLLVNVMCFPNEMLELASQSIIIAYNLFCGKHD